MDEFLSNSITFQLKNVFQKKSMKSLLILLPLSRENIASYLSPILGQYSIKPKNFLFQFVDEFNILTDYIYDVDFDDFINDKITFLSSVNLIIPVEFYWNTKKLEDYSFRIFWPTYWSMHDVFWNKKYRKINYLLHYRLFNLSMNYTYFIKQEEQFIKDLQNLYYFFRLSIISNKKSCIFRIKIKRRFWKKKNNRIKLWKQAIYILLIK